MINGTIRRAPAREAFLCLREAGADRVFVFAHDDLGLATYHNGLYILTRLPASITQSGWTWVDGDETNSTIYNAENSVEFEEWSFLDDGDPLNLPTPPSEWHDWGCPPLKHFTGGVGEHASTEFVFFHNDEVISLSKHWAYAWKEGVEWEGMMTQRMIDVAAYIQKKTGAGVRVGVTDAFHMLKVGNYLLARKRPETLDYTEHSTDYIEGTPAFSFRGPSEVTPPVCVTMGGEEVYRSDFNFADEVNRIMGENWRMRVWEGHRPVVFDDDNQRLIWAPLRAGMHRRSR